MHGIASVCDSLSYLYYLLLRNGTTTPPLRTNLFLSKNTRVCPLTESKDVMDFPSRRQGGCIPQVRCSQWCCSECASFFTLLLGPPYRKHGMRGMYPLPRLAMRSSAAESSLWPSQYRRRCLHIVQETSEAHAPSHLELSATAYLLPQ